MNILILILQGLFFSSSPGAAYKATFKRIEVPPTLQRRDTTAPQTASNNTNVNNMLSLTWAYPFHAQPSLSDCTISSVQDLLYLVDVNSSVLC